MNNLVKMPTLNNEKDIELLFKTASLEAKKVFELLSEEPNLTKTDIQEMLDMSQSIAFRTLTELTSKLLIDYRQRGIPKFYFLSENGHKVLKMIKKQRG